MAVKAKLHLAKPPKPVSEMTDEELRAFAEQIYDAMKGAK